MRPYTRRALITALKGTVKIGLVLLLLAFLLAAGFGDWGYWP